MKGTHLLIYLSIYYRPDGLSISQAASCIHSRPLSDRQIDRHTHTDKHPNIQTNNDTLRATEECFHRFSRCQSEGMLLFLLFLANLTSARAVEKWRLVGTGGALWQLGEAMRWDFCRVGLDF